VVALGVVAALVLFGSAALSCIPAATVSSAPPNAPPAAEPGEEPVGDICRLVDTTVDLKAGGHVRASAEGPVLSEARTELGSGSVAALFRRGAPAASVVARADGVTVRVVIDAPAVAVYPSAPVAVGGFYVPRLRGDNPWHYAPTTGLFEARFSPPAGLTQVRPLPLVTLRCGEVSLRISPWSREFPSRDLVEGFGFDLSRVREVVTRTGGKVPLATSPAGEPVAMLDSSTGIGLMSFDERDGFVHVAAEVEDGLVFGWIARSFIDPKAGHRTRAPEVWMEVGRPIRSDRWYRCFHEIPLFVSVANSRSPVGVIGFNPGRFGVVASAPDFTIVETHLTSGLPLIPGVEFVVRTQDLDEGCERTSVF
jgi:hypothetical protein